MLCLVLTLPVSKVSDANNLASQSQNPSSCLPYEPSVVELSGTIVRRTFPDAQDRPETYWYLDLSLPICVNPDPEDPDLNYAQKDVRSVQLVFLKHKMFVTNNNLVGKKVTARGTLFAGITAHHHASVLLTVSTLRMTG
jgi:hypothetical protein